MYIVFNLYCLFFLFILNMTAAIFGKELGDIIGMGGRAGGGLGYNPYG